MNKENENKKRGYIYGIVDNELNEIVYIGSSFNYPCKRKSVLKYETFTVRKNTPIMKYFIKRTADDPEKFNDMFSVETLYCGYFENNEEGKEERLYIEREYIDYYNPKYNTNRPIISYEERLEKIHEWQSKFKNSIPEKRKEPKPGTYYAKNREAVLERTKGYIDNEKRRNLYKK